MKLSILDLMERQKHVTVNLIAAVSLNNLIGNAGKIPWRLPSDLREFRRRTMGSTVIMGRKTFESLGQKPLPGRKNIVVSSSPPPSPLLCAWASSPQDAVDMVETSECWVIGGSEIYKAFLPSASRIVLTTLQTSVFPADPAKNVYFPAWRECAGTWCLDDSCPIRLVRDEQAEILGKKCPDTTFLIEEYVRKIT
jgi:dihydrofolate reductase